MQLANVIGNATATVKHASLEGWRMLIVQPVGNQGQPDGTPLIAIDSMGSGIGSRVILTSDGKAVSKMVKASDTPIRWVVIGVVDDTTENDPALGEM